MLLRFINSNRIGVIVILVALPLIAWLPDWLKGAAVNGQGMAGTLVAQAGLYFNNHFRFLSWLVAMLFILTNAYLLIQLNTIFIFIPGKTQLPAYFYIILAGGFNGMHLLTPALVSSALFILVIFRIMDAYRNDELSLNFLDAGFLTSIASMIYFPTIFLFPVLILGLALKRPFNWREWVFTVLGLILPYLFLVSGYYLAGARFSDFFNGFSSIFTRRGESLSVMQWIGWIFILGMLIYGSLYMISAFDNMKIRARKIFILLLGLFVASTAVYFIIPGTGQEMIYFIAIPVAYLFSHYFFKCNKNWFNEALFSAFLVGMILLQIF